MFKYSQYPYITNFTAFLLGCQVYGFLSGLSGCSSIMSLASVAIERYCTALYACLKHRHLLHHYSIDRSTPALSIYCLSRQQHHFRESLSRNTQTLKRNMLQLGYIFMRFSVACRGHRKQKQQASDSRSSLPCHMSIYHLVCMTPITESFFELTSQARDLRSLFVLHLTMLFSQMRTIDPTRDIQTIQTLPSHFRQYIFSKYFLLKYKSLNSSKTICIINAPFTLILFCLET